MTKCSNCHNDAQFQYAITPTSAVYYCGLHLPKFLRGKTPSSLLVSKVEEPVEVVAPKKKTAKKEPVPAVEEPTEEPVEETDGTD